MKIDSLRQQPLRNLDRTSDEVAPRPAPMKPAGYSSSDVFEGGAAQQQFANAGGAEQQASTVGPALQTLTHAHHGGRNQVGHHGHRDTFHGGPNSDPKLAFGLTRKDEGVAKRLADTLGAVDSDKLKHSTEMTDLTQGDDGLMHAPNGDPLIRTSLDDGATAYVDPKTDQYYLKDPAVWTGPASPIPNPATLDASGSAGPTDPGAGDVNGLAPFSAHGPFKLPKQARFDGDNYSPAAVRELCKIANPPRISYPSPGPITIGPAPIVNDPSTPIPFPDPVATTGTVVSGPGPIIVDPAAPQNLS